MEVLKNGARAYIDKNRPTGSVAVNKDHTISAAEIIRDPEAAAHLSREEQNSFANSKDNLIDLDGRANVSKKDLSMDDWLKSTRFGKTPAERFDISEDELRERERVARARYAEEKRQGELLSVETGLQSQKKEAMLMGKKALKGICMTLLAELTKTAFQKFALWLKSKRRNIKTLIAHLKNAIHKFIGDLKKHIATAAKSAVTSLAAMLSNPVIDALQKAWTFIRQGFKTVADAIKYVMAPENRKQPFSILILEVGKIIVAGLTAAGTVVLSETIRSSLTTVPFFAITIPGIGSLADIFGLFFGALVSGIVGAIALNLIDRLIARKQLALNGYRTVGQNNKVLCLQSKKIAVSEARLVNAKVACASEIAQSHHEAFERAKECLDTVGENVGAIENPDSAPYIATSANSKEIGRLLLDIDSL